MKKNFIILFLGLSITVFGQTSIVDLRTEYLKTPLGIDIAQPRFSWRMQRDDQSRSQSQSAYQISVQAKGREVWNSGKVIDDESVGIPYMGESLMPETRYLWRVEIWDQEDVKREASSWFETGLMDTSLDAWDGAQWIGGSDADMVFYPHALSVFQLSFNVQLDEQSGSEKAAFAFGGNDSRLMDRDLNLMGVEVGEDESYLALELDISGLSEDDGTARVNMYRVGYSDQDAADKPLYSVEVPTHLINHENRYESHEITAVGVFGLFVIYVDGMEDTNRINSLPPNPSPFNPIEYYNLNPAGRGNNFISFPMLGDIGFRMDPGHRAIFSNVRVRNYRDPANELFRVSSADPGIFTVFEGSEGFGISEQGFQLRGHETGTLLLVDPSKNATPMLRTTFSTEGKDLAGARLYVTSRGIYEIYLNGNRVGVDYFNPGVTQYYKHHMYQTYDVTDQVESGTNALGAWLGEGWWSGNITYQGENWNYFGDRQSLLARLVLEYEDGTRDVIISNSEDWKLYTDGPIRNGSFFQGEVYDARKEQGINGWSTGEYDDSGWKQAHVVPIAGTTPKEHTYEEMQLLGQMGLNARVVDTLIAEGVTEVRPGVFVYDMGQNMVGVPQITLTDSRDGQVLNLRYAEVLYPDLDEYGEEVGMVMMENIRAALTTDRWIAKGGPDIIQPRFTFHGYRYLEVTGITEALPLESVKGLVVSSVHEFSSSYTSSSPLVNRLWWNIAWSMRSNFLSIPTDTPARNERMGWSGDLNVFAEMATYLADISPFLRRHMLAMRDLQRPNGRFPDVAPVTGGFGGTLWGSAGVKVAWEAYKQYGDIEILREHYDAMKAYVDFLTSRQDPETGIIDEGPLGDWLSPENEKNDNTLMWTAYQVRCLEIVAKTAELLGKREDADTYAALHQERKAFFNAQYVDPETHKTIHSGHAGFRFGPPLPPDQRPQPGDLVDTQASYAIPLDFDVFDETHKSYAISHLVNTINRENKDDGGVVRPAYSLMTGFIGTASLNLALSENGKHETAYQLLLQETYPSWLYPVINGATSIWERLNSYTIEEGFGGNNSMNSFNHYAFGAVGAWMYNYSLGIQRGNNGFKTFKLEPIPDPTGKMTWAKGHYDSMYGRIESGWESSETGVSYRVVIPPNTIAHLTLQAPSEKNVTMDGKALKKYKKIERLPSEEGETRMALGSGTYTFQVEQ